MITSAAQKSLEQPEVTHTGVVTSILSARNNGSIFKMDAVTADNVVSIKIKADYHALPSMPSIGEVWRVSGAFSKSKEYGTQLIATECCRTRPKGTILIQFIGNNRKFAGVGNTKAKRLWAAFGEDLYSVLDRGDVVTLTDKKKGGLTHVVAQNLVDTWATYAAETPVIEWLNKHEFPVGLASKVVNFWGSQALEKINDDPYRLLAFAKWKEVDRLAFEIGISKDDNRRKAAALEDAAYDRYDRGNTAATESEIRAGFIQKTGIGIRSLSEVGDLIRGRIVPIQEGKLYQSVGSYALEKLIKERIVGAQETVSLQESLFRPIFNVNRLCEFEKQIGFAFNQEQRDAVITCLENRISCITGGAGVGKTTVLQAIYDQIGTPEIIYQVALTGRAAKRMNEATGLEATTIASFILKAKDKQIQEECFLFIDEASMLDIPILYRLLKVTPINATICFVGDPSQLPPIGPGLPFKKMVDSKSGIIPIVRLLETHRFAKETGILDVADAIRNQSCEFQLDNFQDVCKKGFGISFIDATNQNELVDKALKTYRELNHYSEVQIIAPTNKLCDQINGHLHNELVALRRYQKLPVPLVTILGRSMTVGDPLLYRDRNDYRKELYNGSLGILTEVYGNPVFSVDEDGIEHEYIAEADFDNGNIVMLTHDDFGYISLGYAITVHKSQGSQFERVIFLCPTLSEMASWITL